MHIETGHPVTKDVEPVNGHAVRFIAEDGRCMFEVRCGKDGRSLEVSAIDTCKVDGRLYSSSLAICPNAANSVRVETKLYPNRHE